jgi:1-acyl-sn-glycerol-3-phosphate acyltransferase
MIQSSARLLYGVYALLVSLLVSALVLPVLALTPGLRRRRGMARAGARLIFWLIGVRLHVSGIESMHPGPAIVVANHGSYLDGIILQGALPPTFGFVIKREVTRVPLLHLLLRRIGSEFIDRFTSSGRLRDTRRLVRMAGSGQALAFFPEGTFGPQPGLKPFKLGAFTAASRAGIPVIPVVINGARRMLPAGALLPRPGVLHVRVDSAIHPGVLGEMDARALLRAARTRILEHLDEPDLDLAAED